MGKSKVVGFDALYAEFDRMSGDTREICGRTIYPGAGIVADAVKAGIDKLPKRTSKNMRGVTDRQRAGLKEGFGIARMRESDGVYNVALGFDGYNSEVTAKYPNGHANSMIARSVESGTSFLKKTPFIAPAVRSVKEQAEAAMARACDEEIKKRSN